VSGASLAAISSRAGLRQRVLPDQVVDARIEQRLERGDLRMKAERHRVGVLLRYSSWSAASSSASSLIVSTAGP